MDIADHDPRVIPQLLEFCYRSFHAPIPWRASPKWRHLPCNLTTPWIFVGYVGDVLSDAQRYSEHRAGPGALSLPPLSRDDVKLAVQARVDFSCSGPPPREVVEADDAGGGREEKEGCRACSRAKRDVKRLIQSNFLHAVPDGDCGTKERTSLARTVRRCGEACHKLMPLRSRADSFIRTHSMTRFILSLPMVF